MKQVASYTWITALVNELWNFFWTLALMRVFSKIADLAKLGKFGNLHKTMRGLSWLNFQVIGLFLVLPGLKRNSTLPYGWSNYWKAFNRCTLNTRSLFQQLVFCKIYYKSRCLSETLKIVSKCLTGSFNKSKKLSLVKYFIH